jgi:hypothetical protein
VEIDDYSYGGKFHIKIENWHGDYIGTYFIKKDDPGYSSILNTFIRERRRYFYIDEEE